jgi:magnesium-transporting ATPase (P-type)
VTGDNGRVAEKVYSDLGMESLGTLTGAEIEVLGDAELAKALPHTTIFARVTPEDLGVLAAGVVEGRRIFANTIKYVLMGTSSNVGNMFSAAGASLFLSFLAADVRPRPLAAPALSGRRS